MCVRTPAHARPCEQDSYSWTTSVSLGIARDEYCWGMQAILPVVPARRGVLRWRDRTDHGQAGGGVLAAVLRGHHPSSWCAHTAMRMPHLQCSTCTAPDRGTVRSEEGVAEENRKARTWDCCKPVPSKHERGQKKKTELHPGGGGKKRNARMSGTRKLRSMPCRLAVGGFRFLGRFRFSNGDGETPTQESLVM